MGGNFREKLEEAARIKFCGFKFRGTRGLQMTHVNFELGIHGVNFSFNETRWNASVSSLV